MDFWIDVLVDTFKDGINILPFLFITYLMMEYLEHRTGDKTEELVQKAGKFGPLFGGIFGAFPQCGFSAAATNLYAGRVITLGTLIAIYLSTSDEMLPLFISEQAPISKMAAIIAMKAVFGVFYGFLVDFIVLHYRKIKKRAIRDRVRIDELCKRENCHCEDDSPKISAHRGRTEKPEISNESTISHESALNKSISKADIAKENSSKHEHSHEEGHGNILHSAFIHTAHIFIYVLIFTLILNAVIAFIGEDALSNILQKNVILSHGIAGIIGLIPNCAASIVITELYLNEIITFGTMMSGLLVGAGVGLLILYRVNEEPVKNIQITAILYLIGTFTGFMLDLLGIVV
ncbi:putative manganese transporter [Butyrivibrio sp. WCE2006]|uniref:putative manganese transporter n=1 Tax=Butyrivibrio sp. WCE2006 TaxID=1410611 RepID=UPI0005D21D0C|nr:putative manganese transporter [Butyrivibrio sp. WCE2006]